MGTACDGSVSGLHSCTSIALITADGTRTCLSRTRSECIDIRIALKFTEDRILVVEQVAD